MCARRQSRVLLSALLINADILLLVLTLLFTGKLVLDGTLVLWLIVSPCSIVSSNGAVNG
tara:strand:- start:6833 stop:7012 length:180 start_codon:yes stop_codon:yes gene_type:complete